MCDGDGSPHGERGDVTAPQIIEPLRVCKISQHILYGAVLYDINF